MPLTYISPLTTLHTMDSPNSERIIIPMSKSLIAAVDDFRFENRLASRAETIRALIKRGLCTPAPASDLRRHEGAKGAN